MVSGNETLINTGVNQSEKVSLNIIKTLGSGKLRNTFTYNKCTYSKHMHICIINKDWIILHSQSLSSYCHTQFLPKMHRVHLVCAVWVMQARLLLLKVQRKEVGRYAKGDLTALGWSIYFFEGGEAETKEVSTERKCTSWRIILIWKRQTHKHRRYIGRLERTWARPRKGCTCSQTEHQALGFQIG